MVAVEGTGLIVPEEKSAFSDPVLTTGGQRGVGVGQISAKEKIRNNKTSVFYCQALILQTALRATKISDNPYAQFTCGTDCSSVPMRHCYTEYSLTTPCLIGLFPSSPLRYPESPLFSGVKPAELIKSTLLFPLTSHFHRSSPSPTIIGQML